MRDLVAQVDNYSPNDTYYFYNYYTNTTIMSTSMSNFISNAEMKFSLNRKTTCLKYTYTYIYLYYFNSVFIKMG